MEKIVVIPRSGRFPLHISTDAEELEIFRRADCGPVVESYRWEEDLRDFRLVTRRRISAENLIELRQAWERGFRGTERPGV